MGDTLTFHPGDCSSNPSGPWILLHFLVFFSSFGVFLAPSGVIGVKMLYLSLKLTFFICNPKKMTCYSSEPFFHTVGAGGGGAENLKKLMTSFMNGPKNIQNICCIKWIRFHMSNSLTFFIRYFMSSSYPLLFDRISQWTCLDLLVLILKNNLHISKFFTEDQLFRPHDNHL